ncbi:GAF domain-containing protein [Nodosilinea sp. LEGE 07298]|uniref:ATP-binding protein n=1 Tax=Nodosilinea sp. LEGE 07298 TaxID=2777970 RepID=UPI0018827AC3|nr:ATP-binding protein [Nodosilinea sp. LEGE 07298]MBE9107954.1 GAF domain-containing protein [Nodosilinea sp. LEGE 07298]
MVDPIDLTNCDREPIHIPGAIQPHGVLLVLHDPTLEILQVSSNTRTLLGLAPEDLLGQSLSKLFSAGQIQQIRQGLAEDFESLNPLQLSVDQGERSRHFDGIVHCIDSVIILELEPRGDLQSPDFIDFYHQVRGVITHIQKAPSLQAMGQVVVKEVRRMTGFDRVMVYQFDETGAGSVIAEDTHQDEPYLGLRYPATDIPNQARHLYTLNWLRLIPQSQYEPVPLVPALNPVTQAPLNLSLAVLRSVSPLHREYLRNMGVAASMSISLIKNQQVWGLIACHHNEPNYIPYDIRTACEFIGQVMSVELDNKAASEDIDYKMHVKSRLTEFVNALSQADHFLDGMARLDTQLLGLVNATGAIVCSGNQCIGFGQTPHDDDINALLDWIKPRFDQGLFKTQCLMQDYPAAAAYKDIASGVLGLEISSIHRNFMLWFRPEVIQTVNWGGNPNKPVEIAADGSLRLSPRQSFELWQETVKGTSLPWKASEIEAVQELRNLIVGIVLRQADELALMNYKLQRSNEELDSFAYIASHDLKEPLRGIHNYANFLMEDYSEVLDQDGVAKLQTLVRLTQRMEDLINSLLHFSRLDRAELQPQPVDLNDLVQQVTATLKIARSQNDIEFRIPQPLPQVPCDRTQVTELFTNLISNAIKYNDKAHKWIEVGAIDPSEAPPPDSSPITASPVFYVRDNGIGIPPQFTDKIFQIFRRLHGRDDYGGGTGAGLTIARKVVERHGGRIWVKSTPGEGSTFFLTLSPEKTI